MRKKGTLQSWNDERGFGFISPLEGRQQVFLHISDLPKDGSRPTVGEKLTYVESPGRDGRPRATEVERLAFPGQRTKRPNAPPARTSRDWLGTLIAGILLIIALASAYQWFKGYSHRRQLEALPATTAVETTTGQHSRNGYVCDGRTHCSQMTSCAEATWFINNCPGTQMDGDHDGVPCEQHWCSPH